MLGCALHASDAALQGFVGEEGVQDHPVECPAAERQRLRSERGEHQRDVFVELGIEGEQRKLAAGSVVPKHHFALPEATHQASKILHLRRCDVIHTERIEEFVDTAAEAQREAAVGHAMHRGGVAGGDDGVASVVVGCAGGDAQGFSDGRSRAADRDDLFHVEPLGQKHRAETHRFAIAAFVEQITRRLWCAGKSVETEFVQLWCSSLIHEPNRIEHIGFGRYPSCP